MYSRMLWSVSVMSSPYVRREASIYVVRSLSTVAPSLRIDRSIEHRASQCSLHSHHPSNIPIHDEISWSQLAAEDHGILRAQDRIVPQLHQCSMHASARWKLGVLSLQCYDLNSEGTGIQEQQSGGGVAGWGKLMQSSSRDAQVDVYYMTLDYAILCGMPLPETAM